MPRPDRLQLIATLGLLILGSVAAVSPLVREALLDLSWVLLEIIGRTLDRPTSLVVGGYVVVVLVGLGLESGRFGTSALLRFLWQVSCFLALLGQGYILVLAWKLMPWAVVPGGIALAALHLFRGIPQDGPTEARLPRAPVVGLFILIHVLVEGSAGHILTPWLGEAARLAASASRHSPGLYFVVSAAIVLGPLLLLLRVVRRGVSLVGWPSLDLRRSVDWLAPLSLVSLSVVAFHYSAITLNCPEPDGEELQLLSQRGGIFDLALSSDGGLLAVSHREAQFVELLDLDKKGSVVRIGTGRPQDTLFDRTEPETILGLDDGRFLLLAASSDSEKGNALTVLDPRGATLSRPMSARGVSDLVSDGAGEIWIASEFDGLLGRLDLQSGDVAAPIRLPEGSETNKIVVDGASRRAWTAGLWSDSKLRLVDLRSGRQLKAVHLGTHQWDLALSPALGRIYVARLIDGVIQVFDSRTLVDLGRFESDFGVRAIEVGHKGQRVVTGNVYTGAVVVRTAADGAEVLRRSVGGYIKGLKIDSEGAVLVGSICGTWKLRVP
jgi:hypothetical protein